MALVLNADGTESFVALTKDFKSHVCIADDLVNVPEMRVLDVWLNRYPQYICPFVYASKTDADLGAGPNRDACIHVVREYVVGEGMT